MNAKPILTLALAALLPLAGAAPTRAQSEQPDKAALERQLADLEAQQDAIRARLESIDDAPPPAERPRRARADNPGELIDAVDPAMRERFERWRAENPERARRFLREHGDKLRELRQLRQSDPEAFERRARFMRDMREGAMIANRIAVLENAGQTDEAMQARAELRDLVEDLFNRRLAHERDKIEGIERRLEEARERLESMEAKRDALLDQRVEQAVENAKMRLIQSRTPQR